MQRWLLSSTPLTIEGEAVPLDEGHKGYQEGPPIDAESSELEIPWGGERLVKRALETDRPGLEFLHFHLTADGKVGREQLEIIELRC